MLRGEMRSYLANVMQKYAEIDGGNRIISVKQSCMMDRKQTRTVLHSDNLDRMAQVEGKRPAGEGVRKHTRSTWRVGGKQVRGVAKQWQNLPSARTRRSSYQQHLHYQPERTPSNETLSRNLGSKGKGGRNKLCRNRPKGGQAAFLQRYRANTTKPMRINSVRYRELREPHAKGQNHEATQKRNKCSEKDEKTNILLVDKLDKLSQSRRWKLKQTR